MKSGIILKTFVVCLFTSSKSVGLEKPYSPSVNLTLSRLPRQSDNSGDSCILPAHPENGRWIIRNGKGKPGEKIPVNSILEFKCNIGYKLTSTGYLFCIGNNNWNSADVPECERLCSPIHSTSTTITRCVAKSGIEVSCTEATEGTYLSYKCVDFYEAPIGYKRNLICIDGYWNYPMPVCQPVCGKKVNTNAKPLVYGGNVTEVIEYPWLAVLYKKDGNQYENICGGTIISPNIVLTVAHCVTNPYGDAFSEEKYLVAAAKLFNKYIDNRDPNAQYLEISRIIVHPSYKGELRRYVGDLAILVTKRQFVLNELVQPVCFNDVNSMYIYPSSVGVVSGFGVKEDGFPSDELRTLEIPFKDQTTCIRELPKEWAEKYSLADKICAGFYNKSIAVCPGDSGNGLIFRSPEDNRFYLHGLVSLGLNQEGQCNSQLNTLYTRVASYYEFVDREVSKYQVKDCLLPPYPEHGKWIIKNEGRRPHEIVPSNTFLEFICEQGYRLSLATATVECGSISNTPIGHTPTCEYIGNHTPLKPGVPSDGKLQNDSQLLNISENEQKLCMPIRPTSPIIIKCVNNRGTEISCKEATGGSRLSFTCADFYEVPLGYHEDLVCRNGKWNYPLPVCQPVCGKKIEKGLEKFLPGNIEYPWIVVLYRDDYGDYDNVCGGTIISLNMVLTAAHCVTDQYGNILPKEKYKVTAKKLHSLYTDGRDRNAQYLEILHIIVHPSHKGQVRNFIADIAVIITKKPFVLNKFVQPICFNDLNNINLQANSTGVVSEFGVNKDGIPRKDLRILEVRYKDETTCVQELQTNWTDKYSTIDKICAGFENKTTFVCKGDNGNGLVFRNPKDDRYYIHGIAIAPFVKQTCTIQQNFLYTKVASYYPFVVGEMRKYQVDGCSLPNYPKNGKWTIENEDSQPGQIVPLDTLLKFSCNQGYKLSLVAETIRCDLAWDISVETTPTCERVPHRK